MSITKEEKLELLKVDVGMLTSSKDKYLEHLLELAERQMNREGIKKETSTEYEGLTIQYAAYLFRKRAGEDTTMPKYLRWGLNNLLFSQKARGYAGSDEVKSNDI